MLTPGLVFILGASLIPLLRGRVRQLYLLALPVLALISLYQMPKGAGFTLSYLGYELVLARVDQLSLAFAQILIIAALIGFIYSFHLKEAAQPVAAALYAGGALGVVFAGDFLTLFIFWEVMALASTYLIWARGTKASYEAGLRYILVHIFGGLCLLAGIFLQVGHTGSIAFLPMELEGLAAWLILIGFIVNAAVPPFSAWLSDAYPEATTTGIIFLAAFTTKTAVYVLLRGFPGTELLMWLGAFMAFYGVVLTMLADDIRRLLSYHIISQVGYMVAGVGIGTALALNGAAAHAITNILYKGLLMMGVGAILQMTGRCKLSELGGLYRTMPVTLLLYLIAGFSISGVPLFAGFISKTMILDAAAKEHLAVIWFLLKLASVGTFLSTTLKVPYYAFFGKDSGLRPREAPANMLVAMGLAAFLCVLIGVYPQVLYQQLPYQASHFPYTAKHVVGALQLLFFTALAYFIFPRKDPVPGKAYIILDTDWFYRRGAQAFMGFLQYPFERSRMALARIFFERVPNSLVWVGRDPVSALSMAFDTLRFQLAPAAAKAGLWERIKWQKQVYPYNLQQHWTIAPTVLWVVLLLLAFTFAYYF
jgi:multicomponent Na+:H+ antiporter subunit D